MVSSHERDERSHHAQPLARRQAEARFDVIRPGGQRVAIGHHHAAPGDIIQVGDAGAPNGTTITVENLFFNTPARLKFLKTTQTELNQAVDLIHRLILAYHELSFKLTHDGYEMIAYPGAGDARLGVAAVWGHDTARDMVPLEYDSPGIAIRGFVSKPSVSRASRSAQATFVNGRFVRSRTVIHAFDAAFRSLMTSDRHPVLALFVDIAPELVDVNVHPAKTEVRFTRDGDVYAAVHRAVQNALLTGGLVPEVNVQASLSMTGKAEVYGATPPRTALSSYGLVDVRMSPVHPDLSPQPTLNPPVPDVRPAMGEGECRTAPSVSPSPSEERTSGRGGWGETSHESSLESPEQRPQSYIGFDGHRIGRLRVLAQSRNTYIVAETDDAILFIDQHIAHERVLYEQMMNGATDRADRWGVVAQHLALPQTLHWGAREARIVAERLTALEKSGFVLEPFGGDAFVLRAVPASIAHKDYLGTLRAIVDEMTGATESRRLLVPHESAIIMASCKMAVKKGDPLTMDEMTRLLSDLAQMRNPFTCPHGRPILLALTHYEMDRKFHRIGPH